MLIPPPEANLGDSPLVSGADVLEIIDGKEGIVIEDVMLQFLEKHDSDSPDEFMDALCLLYALGLIEYQAFKLTERKA